VSMHGKGRLTAVSLLPQHDPARGLPRARRRINNDAGSAPTERVLRRPCPPPGGPRDAECNAAACSCIARPMRAGCAQRRSPIASSCWRRVRRCHLTLPRQRVLSPGTPPGTLCRQYRRKQPQQRKARARRACRVETQTLGASMMGTGSNRNSKCSRVASSPERRHKSATECWIGGWRWGRRRYTPGIFKSKNGAREHADC
jgi:hypothetical protein